MPSGRRHFSLILIAYLALGAFAWAGPGYLATVGPAALRFFAPPQHAPRFVLPPVSTNAEPAVSTNGESSKVPEVQPVSPTVPATETPGLTNEVSSGSSVLTPDDVVSPQMLLKYFNKSTNTNGPSSSIIAPIDITPRPQTGGSSKATYSNAP